MKGVRNDNVDCISIYNNSSLAIGRCVVSSIRQPYNKMDLELVRRYLEESRGMGWQAGPGDLYCRKTT